VVADEKVLLFITLQKGKRGSKEARHDASMFQRIKKLTEVSFLLFVGTGRLELPTLTGLPTGAVHLLEISENLSKGLAKLAYSLLTLLRRTPF
jgi:hypothetical protein